MSEQIAISKVQVQAAHQSSILVKLILFSLALAVAPLSSYFISKDYVWNGNATYAAITAIVAANSVLAGYIIMSVMDEKKTSAPSQSRQEPKPREESKKTR